MASFTDNISSFNPYIPTLPVETYAKVGLAKQQMYEQGLQRVEGIYNTIADLPVDSKFSPYIEDKLGSLKKQVTNNISGDFSNSQVINSITQAAGTITNDPIVKNALTSTQAIQSKLKYINDIKTKHPELYSPINEQDALYSIGQWRKNGDLSTPYVDSTPYQPYYDTNKEFSQLQKDYLALPTEYTDIPTEDANGTITTTKHFGKSNADFLRYIRAHASANLKNQLAVEGRVNATRMDGTTWFQGTYTPYVNSQINSLQAQVEQNNINLGKKSLPSEQDDIKAKNIQLKSEIAQLQKSLGNPTDIQKAIASKRELNGEITSDNALFNVANSIAFPKNPEVTYSADQAKIAALKLAAKGIASGSSSTNPMAFSTNAFGNVSNAAGETQVPSIITKDNVSGVEGYKQYTDLMHSLEGGIVSGMQNTFKDYATSAGYTDAQLTDPTTRQKAADQWTGYMSQKLQQWSTDHNDPSVPDNLKKLFADKNPEILTAIGLRRKLDNIKVNALTQAKQNGVTGMTVNGVYVSPEDMYQYKTSGYNGNIATSGVLNTRQVSMSGGFGGPGIPGSAAVSLGVTGLNPPNKEFTNKLSKIPDVSPQLQDVVAQVDFTTQWTNNFENHVKGVPTPNTQMADNLANHFNNQILGATTNGESTDVAGNKLEIGNAISPKQIVSARIDRTTGDVETTINLGTEAKPNLHTFKINSPDLKIDNSADQTYHTLMYLYDGIVPINVEGGKNGKVIPVKISSNGTPASHYTRTGNGDPATYSVLTTTGHKIPTPGFAEPSQAIEWLNTLSSQNQRQFLTTKGQEFIRNYGSGWAQLTQDQKAALLEPVYEKAQTEITEDKVFGSLDNKITDDLPLDLL